MTHSHEDPNQAEAALQDSHLHIGSAAMSGVEHHDQDQEPDFYNEGRPGADRQGLMVDDVDPSVPSWEASDEQDDDEFYASFDEDDTEDPLAGDVDRFVHPDETRTDEQIEFDRRHAIEPYGHDAAEEYGDEMDEYLGVNDFAEEEPVEPALTIEPHKGYPDGSQVYVKTSKRSYQQHPANIQKMRDEGMSDKQIAEKLDTDHDETWKRIRERNRKTAMQMEEDDYEDENPLAGDVDR